MGEKATDEMAEMSPWTAARPSDVESAISFMPLAVSRDSEGGQPWQFVYHECPPFGTIELVDVRMRAFLTDWRTKGAASAQVFAEAFGQLPSEDWSPA